MSAPFASRIYSCTRMLLLVWMKASITLSAAFWSRTAPHQSPGSLQQLHHQGRPAHHGDEVGHIVGAVGIAGDGQAYAVTGEQLHGAQLVPGAGDGHRAVEGHGVHHLELAQHGGTVEGDAGPDARDHGVIALQPRPS